MKVKKGANKFVWDLVYKGAEKLDGMIFWWASLSGPKAIPGKYTVALNVNKESKSETFTILADPRSESTLVQMQQQFEFIKSINKTMDEAHKSIKKIKKINKQLTAFEKQYKGNNEVKDLLEKAKKLKEQFSEIEEALYQTKNRSGQDPLNFPIKLTNKLGHLNSLVSMGDFPPTEQDIAIKNELTQKIESQLSLFNTLVADQISEFNKSFNAKSLNYVFVED